MLTSATLLMFVASASGPEELPADYAPPPSPTTPADVAPPPPEPVEAVGNDGVGFERARFPSGRDQVAIDIFTPSGSGPFPVVLVLHGARPRRAEKHYRALGDDLARHGFLALYVHVFDRGRKSRGSRAEWRRSISEALSYAAALPAADHDRMGVVGFSLGAFLALEQAPADPRIGALVAFYGGIGRGVDQASAAMLPPALLLHGTADRIVPLRRSLEACERLRAAGSAADLVVYPGARHGFCLNSRGGADGAAGHDAWARALSFLDWHLRCPNETGEADASVAGWLATTSGTARALLNPDRAAIERAMARPAVRQRSAPTRGKVRELPPQPPAH